MKIIDLTYTYRQGMTGMSKWHPIITFERLAKLEDIGMNTSGTHMDAARHFIEEGYTIDETPLDLCVGDVTVVDVRHRGAGEQLQVSDLEQYELKERVLLCFGWGKHWANQKAFNTNFPTLILDVCRYMLNCGVRLIGMDIPSPDCQPREGEEHFPVHKLMLSNRIILVETLANTDQIDFNAQYTFAALPLKLEGLDASPCRVILIKKEG